MPYFAVPGTSGTRGPLFPPRSVGASWSSLACFCLVPLFGFVFPRVYLFSLLTLVFCVCSVLFFRQSLFPLLRLCSRFASPSPRLFRCFRLCCCLRAACASQVLHLCDRRIFARIPPVRDGAGAVPQPGELPAQGRWADPVGPSKSHTKDLPIETARGKEETTNKREGRAPD